MTLRAPGELELEAPSPRVPDRGLAPAPRLEVQKRREVALDLPVAGEPEGDVVLALKPAPPAPDVLRPPPCVEPAVEEGHDGHDVLVGPRHDRPAPVAQRVRHGLGPGRVDDAAVHPPAAPPRQPRDGDARGSGDGVLVTGAASRSEPVRPCRRPRLAGGCPSLARPRAGPRRRRSRRRAGRRSPRCAAPGGSRPRPGAISGVTNGFSARTAKSRHSSTSSGGTSPSSTCGASSRTGRRGRAQRTAPQAARTSTESSVGSDWSRRVRSSFTRGRSRYLDRN